MPPQSDQAHWFAKHVQPHEPVLRAWLRSRFPRGVERDDLVQEALARVLRLSRWWRVSALTAFLLSTALSVGRTATAQGPSPATNNAPAAASTSDPVVLTPFTVSTERDNGYAANETLAGTRMRTNLRDVGASLTVLTPEFMQDLAANSLDKALLYTPSVDSVEGDNVDPNRASGQFLRFGTGQQYSIRGFVSNSGEQGLSHDFFSALESNDAYNLERITLSRGPNALLIGVGNPQGAAVTTTKRAQLTKQKTTVQAQYDRWSSRRVALDHNQPLVPGRLAVRLNLLHDEKREFRLYEGRKQDRLTFGVTAQPFRNTTITANHESYSINRNVAPLVWAFDGGALQWLAKGRPTVNFQPRGLAWAASGNPQASFDPRNALTQFAAQQPTYIVGLNLPNPMVNTRFQTQVRPNTFGGINSQASFQTVDPWALFGLSKDANLQAGTWDDPEQRLHGRWSQLFLEQKIIDGLHLEVAGNVARDSRSFSPDAFNIVKIDVDRFLPDGTTNPGFQVPYAETQGQYRDQIGRLEEYRATLSYEFDLKKVHRWLGQHNLGGLIQSSRSDSDQDIFRYFNMATVGRTGAGWTGDALGAPHILRTRAYFVNGQVPYPLPDQFQITKNLTRLNGYGSLVGANANDAAPINLGLRQFLNSTKSRFTNDSFSLGWQARWFGGRLVTVLGYREDDTKSYGVPTVRGYADPAIPNSATDPLRRYFTRSRDVPLNATPSVAAAGLSRTQGVVYHALPWLSFTYNRSNNFSPVANASWKNFENVPAPNSTGKTDDYGVRFYLLGGRLSISANRFTNGATDQARNANAYSTSVKSILTRLRTNYKDASDSHFTAMTQAGGYPADSTDVSDTWSFQAEGYELSAIYNPSARWRVALTGSSNENTLGTHLASFGRYLNTDSPYQGLANWRRFASELRKVEAGQRSTAFDLDPTSPTARTQAGADALFMEQQAAAAEKVFLDERAIEGAPTHRNGKYAFNGLATHTFAKEGALKGWSVGGNFRWRSANVIGFERALVAGIPSGIINANRPIKGRDFWDLGAMLAHERRILRDINLRLQLNVENLFDWSKARLVSSDYDTEGVVGTTNSLVPIRWELRRPRNFILTATFGF